MKRILLLIPLFSILASCQTIESLKEKMTGDASHNVDTSAEAAIVDTSDIHYKLGLRYANGIGGDVDFNAAVKSFRKAAKQGHMKAQLMLGLAYQSGKGVSVNSSKSQFWLTKAAEQGSAEAQFKVGSNFLNGFGAETEEAWGVHWIARAAEQGFPEAQYQLGVSWSVGMGVPIDRKAGAFWVTLASKQEHPEAKVLLPKINSRLTSKELQGNTGKIANWKPRKIAKTPPRSLVRFVQYGLSQQALKVGPVDGLIGPKTIQAIKGYQKNFMHEEPIGLITDSLVESLRNTMRGDVTRF